jgi:CBS domain-containing protein
MKRADRPSIPRTSSHANVKQPTPRAMDINQLNRLEEKEGGRYETPVSRLGQQGDLEADGGADLEVQDGGAHLTFSDVPLKTVLASKRRYGTSLHSVAENESIAAAMELIKSLNIGAVLVHSTNEDGDIVGIISTRDYIEKVSEGVHPTSASVKDFMTESPVFAFDDDLAISCLELMTKHNFRHLPVRERKTGRAIGLVSIGDLVRIMLRQYKESNAYMKDFIHGKYA